MRRLASTCVTATAPGKVILFGEHFVVEGVPAVATAISLRARVRVCESPGEETVTVFSRELGVRGTIWPHCGEERLCFLSAIVRILHRELGDDGGGASVVIESDIPVAAGMGSSAAVAVAFAAAYSRMLGRVLGVEEVRRLAFEAERVVHGRPSGIDNTIAALGGTIVYEKGVYQPVNASLQGVRIVVADSGIERSTGTAVRRVLERKKALGQLGNKLYHVASLLVREAVRALAAGDHKLLGHLMDVNHGLLNAMGVSLPRLEELVYTARREGALGAKITGAGMGGSIIALVEEDKATTVANKLKRIAKAVYIVEPGVEGVRVEEDW